MPSTEPQQPQSDRVVDLPEQQSEQPLDAAQAEQVKGGIIVIDKVAFGDGSVRSVSATDASALSTLQHTGGVNY